MSGGSVHQDREWGHRPARKLPRHNQRGVFVCLHVCMCAHVCTHSVHCVSMCAFVCTIYVYMCACIASTVCTCVSCVPVCR